ncbi:MAG: hypothetical protein HQL77_12875 [Magnetococcales bacterium]|nr:hypothetical protein [Magnetococcales bacterium]
MSQSAPPSTPWTLLSSLDRLVRFLCILFAIWTLYCHFHVFALQSTFSTLVAWSPLVPVMAVLLNTLLRHTPVRGDDSLAYSDVQHVPPEHLRFLGLAVALVATFQGLEVFSPNGRFGLFWILASLFLGTLWFQNLREAPSPPQPIQPGETSKHRLVFLLLALLVILITLYGHRDDIDDRIFLSFASWSVDFPEQPLLSHNGMLFGPHQPMLTEAYRLSTYELFYSLPAFLWNAEPIFFAHVVLPPFFAFLIVVVNTLLAARLFPRYWLHIVILAMFFLLVLGGEVRGGHSAFAFVMLQYGKTILIAIIMPLLILLTMEYMHHPRPQSWVQLALAQVAALGFSSSGLFMAPTAVMITALAMWRADRKSTLALITTLPSSAYLLGIGFHVKSKMVPLMQGYLADPFSIANNFGKAFGDGPHMWLALLALIGGWSLVPSPAGWRFFLGFSFFFMLLIFNPFTQPFVMQHFTGTSLYWRLFLIPPLPILAAIILSGPFPLWRGARLLEPLPFFLMILLIGTLTLVSQWATLWGDIWPPALAVAGILALIHWGGSRFISVAASLLLCVILLSWTHYGYQDFRRRPVLSKANFVHFHTPGYRVPSPLFEAAQLGTSLTPPGSTVLATEYVAGYMSVMRHSPLQVTVNRLHNEWLTHAMGQEEVDKRNTILDYVSGQKRQPDAPDKLCAVLTEMNVGLVISNLDNPWLNEIGQLPCMASFETMDRYDRRFWYVRKVTGTSYSTPYELLADNR